MKWSVVMGGVQYGPWADHALTSKETSYRAWLAIYAHRKGRLTPVKTWLPAFGRILEGSAGGYGFHKWQLGWWGPVYTRTSKCLRPFRKAMPLRVKASTSVWTVLPFRATIELQRDGFFDAIQLKISIPSVVQSG